MDCRIIIGCMEDVHKSRRYRGAWHDLFTDSKTGRYIWSKKQAHAIKEAIREHGADAEVHEVTNRKFAVYYRHEESIFDNLDHLMNPEMDK